MPASVRVRKPRRVHSASWVSMLRGLTLSLLGEFAAAPAAARVGVHDAR